MVRVKSALPVPLALVAERATGKVPPMVGTPLMSPVAGLRERPNPAREYPAQGDPIRDSRHSLAGAPGVS